MPLPTRVLSVGASGNDVAAMHDLLSKLGFSIPATDRRATKYGKGTQRAVAQFQAAHGLEATGTIDAATASALVNAVAEVTYAVSGTVSCRTSASVRGLSVRIVDKNVGGDVPFAATTTDARGAYT